MRKFILLSKFIPLIYLVRGSYKKYYRHHVSVREQDGGFVPYQPDHHRKQYEYPLFHCAHSLTACLSASLAPNAARHRSTHSIHHACSSPVDMDSGKGGACGSSLGSNKEAGGVTLTTSTFVTTCLLAQPIKIIARHRDRQVFVNVLMGLPQFIQFPV